MAGATLEFNAARAIQVISAIAAQLDDPDPMLRDMGEFLTIAQIIRFNKQIAPDGTPWAALSPRYLKAKRKNKDKILQLDSYLKNTMRYQAGNGELEFGTDRPYAAKLHFGGEFKMPARTADVFFKQDKDGSIGNKFVKRKNSNFAQTVNIGPYTIKMPARPILGTSEEDNNELIAIAQRHLEKATQQ